MLNRPDAARQTDRRGVSAPIPPDLDNILNRQQALTLRKLADFGWQLAFVRRPLCATPIAVMIGPDRQRLAVLETDGRVDIHPEIPLRGIP